MDSSTAVLLQELIRRESLSLLSYVGDAFPWTSRGGDAALTQLRHIVAEHKKAVTALGQMLMRRDTLPYIGSFPSGFTAINFLALSHILPRIIESEQKSLAQLEAEVPLVNDADARAAAQQFLNIKRDHLTRLQTLGSTPPAPTTISTHLAS